MTTAIALATTVACGGGGAPELNGLTDQIAQVGTEKEITLNGTDPDGDQLSYRYKVADLTDLAGNADITVSPSGMGVFRWTPHASDVGQHSFDFTVSDGDHDTTVTINIDVRSAVGAATAPIFRSPLGTGTTIDLAAKKCVDLDVTVEDQDTAELVLAMEEPKIAGATLEQQDGTSAKFHWCPSRDQEAEQRYTLTLSADDNDNPKTIKNYLIVLRGNSGTNCAGDPPVIDHTPQNANTIVNLTVDAIVTDDKGLKEAPLFYYSTTNPGTTPNLGPGGMTQLSTLKISGTATDGVYAADVPNPVASMPAGTTATLYYVFVADDDDDETGNCDHSTQSRVYSMTVTSTGTGNTQICGTCTADAQCGSGNLCAYVGSMGGSYCLKACGSGCATGYACSAGEVYSVEGDSAKQCVPNNGSCDAPTAACVDDGNEDDDNQSQASANAMVDGPMAENDTINGVMCPKPVQPPSGSKADDDWRQLKITADTMVDLFLLGSGESDLDLQIYNSSGGLVSKSTTLGYEEEIVKCLKPATYYVKVNGFTNARSEYLLDYTATAQACDTTCTDDSHEDDNTYTQARVVSTFPYAATGNEICPGNDDWFKVHLTAGKTLTMDLTFNQSTPMQDLDIHLYDIGGFSDLWPCSVTDPSTCTIAHGQGATSNEHATYAATTTGDYYVVIRGYNNSTNAYGLNLSVQ